MVYRLVGRWSSASGVALLLVAMWTFGAGPASAQTRGKIAGNAVDAETGETLPGVSVAVEGTTLGALTDMAGDYVIANLDAGTYTIRATYIGYTDVVVQNVQVNPDRTTRIDLELHPMTVELGNEVVVTATRPLVEVDNTSSSVRLQSEEVTSLPTSDLTSVLTTLPGVNFENGQMLIRGGGMDQVAFVIDGARARDPLTQAPFTNINLGAIQDVEVITGSFNAEYGEAQSGVINVITKEGGDHYEGYIDTRYTPPGKKHWGTSFYDQSSPLYWENTHARHLEWWIEYPDQWLDPENHLGSDPNSIWTPEQAYQNYLDNHQPLHDYLDTPSYSVEAGFGGPIPGLKNLGFFGTIKKQSLAPLYGNAFRGTGDVTNGSLKLSYQLGHGMKLVASGFYGNDKTGWGFYPDNFWALTYGVSGRYAYYDFPGFPYSQTDGETLTFSHALNAKTLYQVQFSRVQATRDVGTFPGDSLGFEVNSATPDLVHPLDENGNEITWASGIPIGYHTTGYFFKYGDSNVEWKGEGYVSSQITKFLQVKAGFEHSQYVLDHYNFFKPENLDSAIYRPYQGALYAQSKLELGGMIINAGLRLDYYNPNDTVYTDLFDPFGGEKEKTHLYAQLSPRIGISHPIDSRTALHFSYGHFFERPAFNQYGEVFGSANGNLNTVIVPDATLPFVLGNRSLRPLKTIAYEVGIERNFWNFFVLDLTAYYKDSRNTIRTVTIVTDQGTYTTNGNGDYADNRGIEVSLSKVPSTYKWGSIWGYANFSSRVGIFGRSGAPSVIREHGNPQFPPTGDFIAHTNPILKIGGSYKSPDWNGIIGSVLANIRVSADYRASFPNKDLFQDILVVNGEKHLRPVDTNLDLRLKKDIDLLNQGIHISPYLEVSNLLNTKWLNLSAVQRASPEDQQQVVDSGFQEVPQRDTNGAPIMQTALYRNLPRSILFGVTLNF
ncbi:MAG TPA: TonB-dependent receptor [Rhodothermales bacterium]|nr:TonB-dependent receptor [Rhodothermales bacterium]